ncbi:MAG: hypothetical protein VB017_04105 [Endomicrobiaceae bacterium]|nr:hypothetical protein [Endomicrobiaceae bacterium]
MIKTFFIYLVCGPALLMPCKMRIIYAELFGWTVQGFYYIYYSTMKILLNELKNGKK